MSAVRTGRLTVGGIGSPVIEAGPRESTEAVVFVHGNPGSVERVVVPFLAEQLAEQVLGERAQ